MKFLRYNKYFLAFFGNFSFSDFEISPVWYEYNIPDELDYLNEKEEVSLDWLNENLAYPLNSSDKHPYYTLLNRNYLNHVEFSYIKCEIEFLSLTFDGYFSVINNHLNTLNVFLDNETICFYGTDFFYEEDLETLKLLANRLNNKKILSLKKINYVLDESVKESFKLEGGYTIAVVDSPDGASLP